MNYDAARLDGELAKLRRNGLVMPTHPFRAAQAYQSAVNTDNSLRAAASRDLNGLSASLGRKITSANYDSPEVQRLMAENRAISNVMGQRRGLTGMGGQRTAGARRSSQDARWNQGFVQKTAVMGGGGSPMGGDVFNAIPRFYDPLEYWDLSGLPWNVADEGHRHKLHKWLRLYYATHYLVPILVDIFTRFPLVGMELECLTGDTKIITRQGTRKIADCAGQVVEVLDGRGYWVESPILAYGARQVHEIMVRRNKRTKMLRATDGHRWLVETTIRSPEVRFRSGPGPRKEVLTGDLEPGMILASTFAHNIVKKGQVTSPSAVGVAHGFTYGNGSLATSGGGAYAELHGHKDQALRSYFAQPKIWQTGCECDGGECTRIGDLPAFFKALPDINESTSYLYGWLAGYFAADGSVSTKGEAKLSSATYESVRFARDVCHRLGIKTASIQTILVAEKTLPQGGVIKNWTGWILPIDMGSLTEQFFIIEEHRNRYCNWSLTEHFRVEEWEVVGVRRNVATEVVYCAEVPTTQSFVLEDNILTGNCKDPKLVEVYSDIFLDQLNYEDFLVSLGREYWLVGEAFPLGSFDEDLGIWEHEELINPEDVVIDNFPLLDSQQLKIVPPDYLRRIAQTRSPAREWYMLQQQYEDLIPYLLKGEHIPISPVMLTQVANKLNDWDDHGTPILMRGLRTLLHEEKLMASQDAIAERLYSPFILAKLGIMDMGDGLPPWIPTPDELQSVRDDIDIAMASDFRVMVHHFGLEMSSVFGREQMPRLGDDFDRIERRLMQVFGVNPSLLSAGSNSQPYASSALQAEFMNQILRTFQKMLKDHFKYRAMVVAEAQGHYAYERKGQTRVPIYETVVDWDEEGNKIIRRERKLLVPDLVFSTFDLRDEATERQFVMGLRQAGLPIPDDKLMIGVSWKKDDYIGAYNRDIQKKTISQQRAKMDTYIALVIQGLPVPMDLKYEVESVLQGGTGPEAPPGGPPPGAGGGQGMGGDGASGGMPGGAGGPPGGAGGMAGPPPGQLGPGPGTAPPGGGAPPAAPQAPGPAGNVPQVSNERRPGLTYNTSAIFAEDRVANNEELADLTAAWPEAMRKRAVTIRDAIEISGDFVPGSMVEEAKISGIVTEESQETDDPDTWVIKANQQVVEHDGETIIFEKNRKRVSFPIEASKKYSIIDPLSTELNDTTDNESA